MATRNPVKNTVTGAGVDTGFLSDQFKYSDQHRRRRNVCKQRISKRRFNVFNVLEIPVKTEINNRKASDYNRF